MVLAKSFGLVLQQSFQGNNEKLQVSICTTNVRCKLLVYPVAERRQSWIPGPLSIET